MLRRRYCLVPHSTPRYSAFTDAEAQQALVHVSFKHDAPPCATPRHYKRALTEDIFQTALNKRFYRLSRQRDPPFYVAEASAACSCMCLSWTFMHLCMGDTFEQPQYRHWGQAA